MSLTAHIWNEVLAKASGGGILPKTLLPDWNRAMKTVHDDGIREGEIRMLEKLTGEMKAQGKTVITTVNAGRLA
jgi:hypothetical protein